MSKLNIDGYIKLNNIYDEKLIDTILDKINSFRESTQDYGMDNVHTNLGNRIGRLHYLIKEYHDLILNDHILNIIKEQLKDPIILGSLTFENGTEQAAHIDSWFFYTKPLNSMIGIWIALEDIDDDQGPLFYYENSHLLDYTCPLEVNANLDISETGNALTKNLFEKIQNMKKIKVTCKKGDVFIWNSKLVHGGSSILNENKTRNSIVFHLIDKDSKLFNFNDFMRYGTKISDDLQLKPEVEIINDHLSNQKYNCVEYVNKSGTYSVRLLENQ
jgi:ectoine hydroxylase-related dioxygenase (phytanoyl-CoA dioxygenase family)